MRSKSDACIYESNNGSEKIKQNYGKRFNTDGEEAPDSTATNSNTTTGYDGEEAPDSTTGYSRPAACLGKEAPDLQGTDDARLPEAADPPGPTNGPGHGGDRRQRVCFSSADFQALTRHAWSFEKQKFSLKIENTKTHAFCLLVKNGKNFYS